MSPTRASLAPRLARPALQVGGLRDTVTPFDPHSDSGTGWTFDWADAGAFRGALGNALYTYRDYRDAFEGIQRRGMAQARPPGPRPERLRLLLGLNALACGPALGPRSMQARGSAALRYPRRVPRQGLAWHDASANVAV